MAKRPNERLREIEQMGVRAVHMQGDVRKEGSVRALFDRAAQEFESIDVLVNNAGSGLTKPFSTMHMDDWDSMLNMHLKGVFLACQLAGESMQRQKIGSIINIASVAGQLALPHRVIYSTAQAGKMMFTKALACEWAPFGIRVNCIAPGTILTDLVRQNFERGLLGRRLECSNELRQAVSERLLKSHPLRCSWLRRKHRMSPARFSSSTAAGRPGAAGPSR